MESVKRLSIMIWFVALCLSACGLNAPPGPHLRVEGAWLSPAPASMPGNMGGDTTSAGYMTIVNDGSEADTLVGASTDAAGVVHLHETVIENNIAKMLSVAQLDIPAQSRVEFKPGARHLMLMYVMYDLKPGMQVNLTLHFSKSGALQVPAIVKQGEGQ